MFFTGNSGKATRNVTVALHQVNENLNTNEINQSNDPLKSKYLDFFFLFVVSFKNVFKVCLPNGR